MGRSRIRLRGIGPHLEGKFWESENRLRIGRLDNIEIVLNDPSISRRHAEVVVGEQGWVIRDSGSTNGTFLNGLRVGRTDRKVRQRDVVQCGNLVMVVAVLEEDILPAVETPSNGMQVQISTQNSWEKALEAVALDSTNRPRAGDKLLTLLRAGHHLCHIATLDELLRSILDDAVAALDAQRGSIVLADETTGQLQLRAVSTGDREMTGRVSFSKSLAQRSFNRKESLMCRDVTTNTELLMTNSIADGTMFSIICALLRSPRKRLGVLHLDRGPFQDAFTPDDLHLADALAASVSAAIESAQLLEKQQNLFVQTVTALAQAAELRDPAYTSNHLQRVTDYALLLADELQMSSTDRRYIQIGAPLHDIGKIGIDDSILRKPGKLTSDEFELMKTHTLKGDEILKAIPDLTPIRPIVRSHHERWDGKGYPDGLAGENIPILGRILAVADAFDAMTIDRPYRSALPVSKAFAEIADKAGSQFDPQCAAAFLRTRDRVEDLLRQHNASPCDTVIPGDIFRDADATPMTKEVATCAVG